MHQMDEQMRAVCSALSQPFSLAELLNDPMTRCLMVADRVEYSDLKAILQAAGSQFATRRHSSV